MKSKLARAIATWFGVGYSPVAPGTAGSLVALAVAYELVRLAGWKPFHFALLSAGMLAPAVWSAGVAERESGRRDPGFVVIDEVLGQWVALSGARSFQWKSVLAALCLFRLFDIWKPPPVRRLEALPGGAGIVADDLMAGGYSALVLFVAGCFNLY